MSTLLKYNTINKLYNLVVKNNTKSKIACLSTVASNTHSRNYVLNNERNLLQSQYAVKNNTSFVKCLHTTSISNAKARVTVTYHKATGEKLTVEGKEGDDLLDIAVNNNLDLEGFGACEGTLSCSTCHLVFKKDDFNKISEQATDEELDMLDLAYGLTDTSRLGCQVCITKELDGVEVEVPEGTADARTV